MRIFRLIPAFALPLLGLACVAASAQSPATIRRVVVFPAGDTVKVEIIASGPVSPQTQVITGPDRLIVDFPNSLPGLDLRNITINHGQVKALRISLFTQNPPVTRVVVDLMSPQPYEIFPSGSTVVLKLNAKAGQVASQPPTPAPQPTTAASKPAPVARSATPQVAPMNSLARAMPTPATAAPPVAQPVSAAPALPPPPHMAVDFKNGKLKIFSDRASLAEVLAEVRRRTGADIGIPPGASQEQVFGTLGPGTPRDVMAALLNGSHFNFVMVGMDADPAQLRSVILTPRDGAPLSMPAVEPSPAQPQNAIVETQPDNTDAAGAPEAPAIVDDNPNPDQAAEPTPAENPDNSQAEPDMAPRHHHRRAPDDPNQPPPQ